VQLIDATAQWVKMRKSLGSKRREISPEQIADIVRAYGENVESETSKIFRTTDFGYTTITVERPLQLNWAFDAERLPLALAAKPLAALSDEVRATIERLAESSPIERSTDADAVVRALKKLLAGESITLTAPQLKALLAGLSERDDTAPVIRDAKGNPLPDTDLRDTENVPLSDDVDDYIAREIAPHLEHFWVDRSKDKVGYEIPFTRHFYKYVPPRSLDEIDSDLNKLIAEITVLLAEVEKR
jgi:type I restriction enzyme M protein